MRDTRLWEAYQRNKLRDVAEKKPVAWHHFTSLTVAAVSFIISIFTFYTSSLQQVDDLSVIMGSNGYLSVRIPSANRGIIPDKLHAGAQVVFINAGNRPISVLNVRLAVGAQDSANLSSNSDSSLCYMDAKREDLETTIEPFVIKSGEILAKPLNIKNESATTDEYVLPKELIEPPSTLWASCAIIGYATPDSGVKKAWLLLYKVGPETAQTIGGMLNAAKQVNTPHMVLQKTRTTIGWLNRAIDWAVAW